MIFSSLLLGVSGVSAGYRIVTIVFFPRVSKRYPHLYTLSLTFAVAFVQLLSILTYRSFCFCTIRHLSDVRTYRHGTGHNVTLILYIVQKNVNEMEMREGRALMRVQTKNLRSFATTTYQYTG